MRTIKIANLSAVEFCQCFEVLKSLRTLCECSSESVSVSVSVSVSECERECVSVSVSGSV